MVLLISPRPMKLSTRCLPWMLALTLAMGPLGAQSQSATAEAPAALLEYAASDFRQHMKPPPARFRQVRLGQFIAPDGQTRQVLCGHFKVGKAGPWTAFATVATSPYEQWQGGGAEGFCRAPGFKPGTGGDLSAALTRAVAATPAPISSAPAR